MALASLYSIDCCTKNSENGRKFINVTQLSSLRTDDDDAVMFCLIIRASIDDYHLPIGTDN